VHEFPDRSSLDRLGEPPAQQFNSTSDALQQLLGDALLEVFGARVTVSAALGNDDSIDAFIESTSQHSPGCPSIAMPAVIQCCMLPSVTLVLSIANLEGSDVCDSDRPCEVE